MALTKRLVKGSPLTFAEGDANLDYLAALATNTSSFATKSSNVFIGDQTISGSIIFPNGAVISGSINNYLEIVPRSSTSGVILWDSVKNNYLVVLYIVYSN